ncbi:MAG: hypothetical protein AAGD09_01045 [Cyanobacteria bacterium P01_F01_bin.56]
MLRGNKFQTPRWIWLNSAIAAAMFHSLFMWWGLSAWQNRHATTTPLPAPIRVIALPTSNASEPSAGAATVGDSLAFGTSAPRSDNAGQTASSAGAATNFPVSNQAISPNNPSPTQPPVTTQPPAQIQSSSPVSPAAAQTTTAPVLPQSAVVPQPANPTSQSPAVSSPRSSSSQPPTSSPVTPTPPVNSGLGGTGTPSPTPPTNPATGPGSTASPGSAPGESASGGFQSRWSLQEVPGGGSDIHDEIPQMPLSWQAQTAALLEDAGCAAGLIAPGASVSLTMRPTVDAQGRILEFLPWEAGNSVPSAVVQCVEGLKSQMPLLTPARDGGEAIASDAILLNIEIRNSP